MLTMLKIHSAGYRQGVAKTERKRCDTCAHGAEGRKQHGMNCSLYQASCKTHGVCAKWANREAT